MGAENSTERFTLYIPPYKIPMEIIFERRKDLNKIISEVVSKTSADRKGRYPKNDDWLLIDITSGKRKRKLIYRTGAHDYIELGATYLALSAKGASKFYDNGIIHGSEERVRKWIIDMLNDSVVFTTVITTRTATAEVTMSRTATVTATITRGTTVTAAQAVTLTSTVRVAVTITPTMRVAAVTIAPTVTAVQAVTITPTVTVAPMPINASAQHQSVFVPVLILLLLGLAAAYVYKVRKLSSKMLTFYIPPI
ncbi:hypothetical protein BDD12DRAFT_181119 [Trichophaea hybrida]|nr:hypothetical protein BDD12DRAFT_181119 [Trichophaea hybrida]